MLTPGDPAPWFVARSTVHPQASFATLAGRYVVLTFFGSSSFAPSRNVLDLFEKNHARFDMFNAYFCGVGVDPDDERLGRVRQQWPGMIYFWDFDAAISLAYGATSVDSKQYLTHTLILDPALRVVAVVPIEASPETHVERVLEVLSRFPPVTALNGLAPVLSVPYVFEPEFCRKLIDLHEQQGGVECGMLPEADGQTMRPHDPSYKQRTDYNIADPAMISEVQTRLKRRLIPEIKKAFQFDARHIERYIVSCYDAQAGGHFRAHRDDTTKDAAHRRFAVTINLNAGEYEGGDLRFPEFGFGTYRASTGGAIVFSCSLLHEVIPVTRGKRYAFLPFLYDNAAAKIREANERFTASELRETVVYPATSTI
ncbi:MAG: alkyl hydroperoxide reductase/Thiol specific antioxidant/Mal allergen [Phycisphaerales bacterium]|nr:alkyl hydroperoxide reductase/Thiol specific antioxidant/Mal allergen [Phycisphaerales bacterium]